MKRISESILPKEKYKKIIDNSRKLISADEKNVQDWYKNYSTNHVNRLSFDLEYFVNEYPDFGDIKVLELGSTPPILTLAMKQMGCNVVGYDIEPIRFKTCIDKNELKIIKGVIGNEELPFKDNSFDVIIMNEIFEHLNSNLIFVFQDLKRVLKPKGKLFLSTPNLKSLVGIKNYIFKSKAYSCCGELYDEYDKILKFGHMGHVREYTSREVILFLEKMEFRVEKLIYRGKFPKKYRLVDIFLPRLKPFFSVVVSNSKL